MWRHVEAGDFRVDSDTYCVSIRNRRVRLSPKEFTLMLHLAKRAGRIVSHTKLIDAIWGANDSEKGRERLRVLIQQVRRKLETPDSPQFIITEPCIGYRFEPRGPFSEDVKAEEREATFH